MAFSSPEPTILLACGGSRALPHARRIVGSGDENEPMVETGILLILEDFGSVAYKYLGLPNDTLKVSHHCILFSDRGNQQSLS